MSSDTAPASPNRLKAALKARTRQIGLWSGLGSNIAAEIIGHAGFDWIVLDTEHAPNEVPALLSQLQAMAAGTAEPVVRCAWNDPVLIKRILDLGVRSLLVPFVQNAAEARRAVSATRRAALGEIEAIAAVDGVDGIFIGPSDLAADLGHLGRAGDPEPQAAIADAVARIRAAGKAAGILTADTAAARRYLDAGFSFVAVGADTGVLAQSAAKLVAEFKG
jgi:4-hydroxy-2-oxoheptanedioate aldolase